MKINRKRDQLNQKSFDLNYSNKVSMLSLGFSMEELMFPENHQQQYRLNMETEVFIDRLSEVTSDQNHQPSVITVDDEDDDWFTTKHLQSSYSSMKKHNIEINDDHEMLFYYQYQESSDTTRPFSSTIVHERENSISETFTSSSKNIQENNEPLSDQSEPNSSSSFCDQSHRRRRKRTIFTTSDIDQLKKAFARNPKPSQQDITTLSEQLGHESYVIRVWFYNKRQASKKRF